MIAIGLAVVSACSSEGDSSEATAQDEAHVVDCPGHGAGVTTTINVVKAPSLGAGTVTSNPSGVQCQPPCSGVVRGGSATLSALPAPGSFFAGWEDECLRSGSGLCTLPTSGGAKNVQPLFTKIADGTPIFGDVPTYHPYFRDINLMQQKAITNGTSLTPPLYSPESPVNRGQMAVFMVRALNLRAPIQALELFGGSPNNFAFNSAPYFPDDVPSSHLFFKHVQKLRDLRITSGTTATTYAPDQPIPLWQMSVFVVRARVLRDRFLAGSASVDNLDAFSYDVSPRFTDVAAYNGGQENFYFRHVQKMAELGIECGSGGRYNPDEIVTRGKMARLIMRGIFDEGRTSCTSTSTFAMPPPPSASPAVVCGNGTCESGENGASCPQDCCDASTSCSQTKQNAGVEYCRNMRVNGAWQGYRWVTQAQTTSSCSTATDRSQQNQAQCGGQSFVCCAPEASWVTGTTCPSSPSSSAAYYAGCYTDTATRALPVSMGWRGDMTPAVCRSLCGAYAYAGVQYSGECFCGNSLGYERVSDGECSMACTGDGSQKCGGSWRNSVYRTR